MTIYTPLELAAWARWRQRWWFTAVRDRLCSTIASLSCSSPILAFCVSLSYRPYISSPPSFFLLQSNNRTIIRVTSGTGCVDGRTRWLKVYEGAKDSFWRKCFVSLQSESWWILSKQLKLRCWCFLLGSRSTAQPNKSCCFFYLNSVIFIKKWLCNTFDSLNQTIKHLCLQ